MDGEGFEKREDLTTKFGFPEEYNYLEVGKSDVIRIKQVTDEESAKTWLTLFSKKTNTTWRLARSYPDSGKVNIFKVAWKCHHNVQVRYNPKAKIKRRSKHTNCPAKMLLTVKRFVANSKAKRPDPLTQHWPCILNFSLQHNHHLNTADIFRPMSEEMRTNFCEPYPKGHKASTELDALSMQISNRNTLPTSRVPPLHTDCDVNMEAKENYQLYVSESEEVCQSDDDEEECRTMALTEENEEKFNQLFTRIRNGLQHNPSAFVPAVTKMLKNVDTFAQTENALLSALHTFASNHTKTANTSRYIPGKSKKRVKIEMQPTPFSSRKTCFKNRREKGGRPFGSRNPMSDHDYTPLGLWQ